MNKRKTALMLAVICLLGIMIPQMNALAMEKPEYLKSGEVYELNIRTTKLSHCFLPGHKIRVTVTSSAKNFIFPNSNTEKGFNSEEIRTANVTVHRNRRYASCIYLPVENGELR